MKKSSTYSTDASHADWTITLSLGVTVCILTIFCLVVIQPFVSLAAIWLPTALLIPVLFHHRYSDWLFLLIATCVGTFIARSLLNNPIFSALPYILNNIIIASMCAFLLRKVLPIMSPIRGLADWVKFLLVAVIFTPIISTLIMALISYSSPELIERSIVWYMSESIAILAVTPLGLIYQKGCIRKILHSHRFFEVLITSILTLTISFLAIKWLPYPFAFISIPLLWTAIRLPRLEAFIIFLCITLMIVLLQSTNIISIALNALLLPPELLFIPLLLILLPANAMAIVMDALRVEKSNIVASENRFRNAMEYSAIGMALISPQGNWLQVNKALCKLLGYDSDYFETIDFQKITHPDDLNADLQNVQKLLSGEIMSYAMEKRYLCHNGEMVWTLISASLVRDEQQNPLYFISQIEDISELKQTERANRRLTEALHEEKELLHITLNSINEAVISTDKYMNIAFMNPVAEKMIGWTEQDAQGKPVNRIVRISSGASGTSLNNMMQFNINKSLHSSIEQSLILHGAHNGMFDVQLAVSPLKTLEDEPVGIVLVIQNVSKSRELMRQLSYNASHDLLTGLSNRGSFEKSLQEALVLTEKQNQQHCLVFIDLDHFKAVNDAAGHAAGDELLRQLSQLMLDNIRNSDRIARLGGDEFALILLDCPQQQGLHLVQLLVDKINDHQLIWQNKKYGIGASAGLALINLASRSSSEYMAQADIACYTAKNKGRGQVCVYEPRQNQLRAQHKPLLKPNKIVEIVKQNQLSLLCRATSPSQTPLSVCFYQLSLQLNLPSNPELQIESLITSAESHRLMPEIDRWFIQRVLIDYGQQIALKGICVAIPLSTQGLLQPKLRQELIIALENTQLPLHSVNLMIDDITLLCTPESNTFIQHLRQLGCKIVLRKVGKNLNEFDRLEVDCVDYVQIDPALMPQLHYNQMDQVLITFLHGAIHRVSAQTLVGPADIKATFEKLDHIGVDLIFGDVIAPETTLENLLSSGYFGIH